MFYLVRAHGKINNTEFIVPEGYGFITLAPSGSGRKSAENDFLFGVIRKSLNAVIKCNKKISKISDPIEIQEINNKKRTFTFLLKSILLPSSNRIIKDLLIQVEEELSKEDGDINNLKSSRNRQKDTDRNNFIEFINSCFIDLNLVTSCESNEEKKELILRWRENIDYIRFYSPGNIMSNINFSFHGIYNYDGHGRFHNDKVSIKKSGVVELYDLTNKINKDIKYKIPRYSVKAKNELDLELGYNYFYIESDGKLSEFSQINIDENYSYDELISKCDEIKINEDAIRTIRDKYDMDMSDNYIQKLICKDVLFVYNFNRMLYNTDTRLNKKLNKIFTTSLKNVVKEYMSYYKRNLKDKEIITLSNLKEAANVLYDIEKRNAFGSYKELVRHNIETLVNPEVGKPLFKEGVYIITSCRVGEPADETYSTNDRIFTDSWKELIEYL